ncbi:uncharacterized protein [Antennarius striatus]|uniref:uncharacterized protein isoform X2 n=1 Tax=Antennarius striatus TaxID=241820 RepID=UPI0035B43C7E
MFKLLSVFIVAVLFFVGRNLAEAQEAGGAVFLQHVFGEDIFAENRDEGNSSGTAQNEDEPPQGDIPFGNERPIVVQNDEPPQGDVIPERSSSGAAQNVFTEDEPSQGDILPVFPEDEPPQGDILPESSSSGAAENETSGSGAAQNGISQEERAPVVIQPVRDEPTIGLIRPPPNKHECYTRWFNVDSPFGTGDWETVNRIRDIFSGQICKTPLQIEAQTRFGVDPFSTGDVIYRYDVITGFVCRNKDQTWWRKRCNDYIVRFKCPVSFCYGEPCDYPTHIQCWTDWYDRDNPSGTGDWETLSNLRAENPGKICPKPVEIEARSLLGVPAGATGDVIHKNDVLYGFVCRNNDQRHGKLCQDYKVRFSCHPPFCGGGVCWTRWYDRDDPSGTGDWELLSLIRKNYPRDICTYPLFIEAVVVGTHKPALSTGQVFSTYNPTVGFVCQNKDQIFGYCLDYKVRFACPCKNQFHLG